MLPHNKQVAKRVLTQEDRYVRIGDILHRIPNPQHFHDELNLRLQLVIPSSMGDYIVESKHSSFTGLGHAGFIKTFYALRRSF